ncbi:MAG: S8 family serine peptidase, partial [Gammaproteobacteria bacterium]
MKTTKSALAVTMAWLIAVQPFMIQIASAAPASAETIAAAHAEIAAKRGVEPRELTGSLDDRRAEYRAERAAEREPGMGEDGTPSPVSPLAGLPIVDTALSAKARSVAADEQLRLIVHLDFLPHAQVFKDIYSAHDTEVEALETRRVAALEAQASKRDPNAKTDDENYDVMSRVSAAERAEFEAIALQNEALSNVIKEEATTQIRALVEDSQAPVVDDILALGGNVEFTTIAGNMVILTIAADMVEQVGKIPGVMRVVEDSMMEGHLSNADRSTMVDPADSSLTGLWDLGLNGGIYDPAIIDSGLDDLHPGMIDSTTPLRDNFCTWYLVAANGSASFNDAFTCDDLNGHGTHVAGIVGSKGSANFPNNLGIAYGVEKLVNLKAGFNNTANRSSMFWSDKYNIVNRALYDTGALIGDPFADDVDGMNLSYGGDTTLDDTDGSRFWDSVISTYSDLPVTISAGNSGPSNTLFSDPAVSYNAITVANFNDRGSSSRNDDIINAGSTVGPTASNRRKPDIAAPGTSIGAPSHNWETGADDVNFTGTSMAAPMVLGVIMDLADAGVFDEVSVKALLINTAQKNLAGMNIESDSDGWDPQIGWGAMNAYAAYFHRFDVFVDAVTPRDTDGDYQLYKGSMRDEGIAGEGRDRATMVWNREATYLTSAPPSEFFSLVDLNLRLYRESNNGLIDNDLDANDNVHQVRINSGAADTDVVINAYSWSTSFSHGDATQSYALATEDNFVRVDHPATFQGIALWPTEVEPNEVFEIQFWLRNDSEVASHNNVFNLELPAGFTLLSGVDTQNVGSAASGGITSTATYSIRAPATPTGSENIVIKHSHNSYNEPYGDFNWNIGLTVAVDSTAPNPNPMIFSSLPINTGTDQIAMTAAFASDIHGPIQYYLDYTGSPSGGVGGTDSGWQESRSYTDIGLQANDEYCYRAWARDNANFRNTTAPSAITCTYSSQQPPFQVTVGAITTTSMAITPAGGLNNLTLGSSGVRVRNSTTGSLSPWQQSTAAWQQFGLTPSTKYGFDAQARNGNADQTSFAGSNSAWTLANPPAVVSVSGTSQTTIQVVLNPNGNGPDAEYEVQNTTNGVNLPWSSGTSFEASGLTCGTSYNFQARARNGDNVTTIIVPLGQATTDDCAVDTDGDGVADSADNCTLIANADQRDTNGDGFGN